MKVIILAGGFGTRLSEYTDAIPKPMAKIGDKPILWHIMKIFEHHALNDFVLALGYKNEIIKEYFSKYSLLNSDFSIDLKSGNMEMHQVQSEDWNVTLVDTGLETMTGGRIKRLKDFIGNQTFMVTYGDGVGNIDIKNLIKFHKSHKRLATVTAVRPQARFGELEIVDDCVKSFKEKPQLDQGWINGGFFVLEPEVFDLISDDSVMFERQPLEELSSEENLMAYKHHGFWKCMDTKRDLEILNDLWNTNPPWFS
jgi:glucose-1-phosphate cytidylyltransferase